MNYEEIKALAKARRCTVDDLVALHPRNDPFYVGTETDKRIGAWFAELWRRFGYTSGVHLRRMHYAVVSQNPSILKPDGLPYENTEMCWNFLNIASTRARYLELVDPSAFVDRLSGEPIDHVDYFTCLDASARVSSDLYEDEDLALPEFPNLPGYSISSFSSPQLYHLEIWCEKSTMNDVLNRLAVHYGAVLQYGKGELSITVALDAIKRFKRSSKPVRIFYVSDFDPAGACMPVSMSRKLEYFIRKFDLDREVKLFPVVLTYEQVKRYDRLLPTPIKDSERRKAKFELRYGEGAVELDALEALYPGELRRILERELQRYYDPTLERRIFTARSAVYRRLAQAENDVHAEFEQEVDALREEHAAIEALVNERLSNFAQRRADVWQAIRERLVEEQPTIDEGDVPKAAEAEERDGALFNSSRGYLEQNAVYQEHKGNSAYKDEIA